MSSAQPTIPPDDPKRSLTLAQLENLPHIGLVGDTYTIVDMAFWGWTRMAPFVLGDDVFAKYPNVKRLLDEVSARPAATRAIALKDKFTFKADMDEEAKHIMFGHLKTKAA